MPKKFITSLNSLTLYPGDLRVAVMKDLRNTYERVYAYAIEDDLFIDISLKHKK